MTRRRESGDQTRPIADDGSPATSTASKVGHVRVRQYGAGILDMAGWTGLEPATSDVTGRRSNQLNYHPAKVIFVVGGAGFEPAAPGV
jgi:hypothetical protein